ncbi:hypothetical protein L6J37_12220 [Photobacterium sp. WH77]|uniref:hypothetical protein n=1 Tax=Photobacterium TaxID=657 RepID=UPI001C4921CC|nr:MULTISPECIES: hypothetical protein [Photobacterium]MBV7263902.1 hypothetical protein [Photobacterium sp. WH24]MCG2837596.1 hypothetical protein [Photobacterium sp. WH77]MCG2845212.1 hypothetical protein [Photobacterium sp. WH80]
MKVAGGCFAVLIIFVAAGSRLLAENPAAQGAETDIVSLSVHFIDQTRVSDAQSDKAERADKTEIPGLLFHPLDGYVEYERIWCLSGDFSVKDYQARIQAFCRRQKGRMEGEWCQAADVPLFSASIALMGETCTPAGETAVVHVYQPLTSPDSADWQRFADVMGYQAVKK